MQCRRAGIHAVSIYWGNRAKLWLDRQRHRAAVREPDRHANCGNGSYGAASNFPGIGSTVGRYPSWDSPGDDSCAANSNDFGDRPCR